MKKRIFSGAQPTGQLHIGNYLGALKNWVALQDEYEAFYCIVNLHAITLPQDPKTLKRATLDLARVYLAAGIDPSRSTIFIQSDVAEHAELTWVLSCIARMGELERMTQFKSKVQKAPRLTLEKQNRAIEIAKSFIDKNPPEEIIDGRDDLIRLGAVLDNLRPKLLTGRIGAKGIYERFNSNSSENVERASVGLFTYPVLMAADILLYQADLVPVGQDQKQHLELTRDIAARFNRDYGETFKIPEPFIPPMGANIRSLQIPTQKMSKSDEDYFGTIFLTDEPDAIAKKIKRAVTDSGTDITFDDSRPAITNLLTIYRLLTGKTDDECIEHFAGKGYGHLKTELAEIVVEFLRPFQERVKQYDDDALMQILKPGAERARSIAANTLGTVYERMGITQV